MTVDTGVETNGHVEKAAPTLGEIGSTGLYLSGGRVRDEFHRRLKPEHALRVYREMRDNDAVIGAILFAIDMVLREVEWHVDPQDETCTACQQEAEFVQQNMDDMSLTWSQLVSAILSFLPFGWSYFETVYKRRSGLAFDPPSKFDDGRIGWRKHALRAQESLIRWDFDPKGGIQAMIQRTATGDVGIPIEKSLLFRTTVARGNPEGRSVLRNAYRSWWLKKRIEEIEGIGVERDLAGLPVARIPVEYLAETATQAQKQTVESMKALVRDVRLDENQGIVFPSEIDENGHELWHLELLSTGGTRQFDTDKIIGRFDQRIAMTVIADFILLGHENVGSKALGVSKVELFTTALASYLDEIAAVVNTFGIPRLERLNGIAAEHWPSIAHDEVKQVDLTELGSFMQAYSNSGGVLDPLLDAHLREVAGFPQPDPESPEPV